MPTHRAGRATLKDVAQRAGVSATTASVVLNDLHEGIRIPESTRERVTRAARELGYSPNVLARTLRTQRSRTIGFLSEDVTTTPFAVAMLAAAQEEAAARDHLLFAVTVGAHSPAGFAQRAVESLRQQQVVGFIYACMFRQVIDPLDGLPERTVFLNAESSSPRFQSIVPDDRQGARAAVEELVSHGHRRIAFLDDELGPVASGERHSGYLAAMAAAGIPAEDRLHVLGYPGARGGLRAGSLLDAPRESRPTALFCFNDRMAMGAYRAIRYRGLRIPQDVSVVGFDDQEFIASELDPPLTTVRLPHREMGRLAVRLLFEGAPDSEQQPRGQSLNDQAKHEVGDGPSDGRSAASRSAHSRSAHSQSADPSDVDQRGRGGPEVGGSNSGVDDRTPGWLHRVPCELVRRDSVARPLP